MGESVELELPPDFDDRTAYEVEQKGWYSGAIARLGDGRRFALLFYDPVRLNQDIASDLARKNQCLVFTSLVVVPAVTRAYMETALLHMASDRSFDRLKPLGDQH